MALAAKNALLEAKQKQVASALTQLRAQVASGQYDFDGAAPNATVPAFHDIVRGLYTGSSPASSSSSSSSSAALVVLSDHEALPYRSHEYVTAVRDELRLAPEMDDQDDLCVLNTKSTGNLKHEVTCPITQCVMALPVTCRLCKHSFDQAAIYELLKKGNGSSKCPIGGCGKVFKKDDLEKSTALERKLKKYHKEQERASKRGAGVDEDMLDVE
jgi:hypothetical protein